MADFDIIFEPRPIKKVILRLEPAEWEILQRLSKGLGSLNDRVQLIDMINEIQKSIESQSHE